MLEALLRILLALSLTTSMFLLTWSVLSYGIYAALLIWTISYARRRPDADSAHNALALSGGPHH